VFTPIRIRRLGQSPDEGIASADIMPLWNAAGGTSRRFFWDGLHDSLQDAVVTSALSVGATRDWLDADTDRRDESDPREVSSLRRIENYVTSLTPPPYPFPIDRALAARGASVYMAQCAQCHAGAAGSGSDTDPNRHRAWTPDASVAYAAFAAGRAWQSQGFAAKGEYIAVPLDGIWMRAPYLHNGSVPTLRALLDPPSNRPSRFWRGYDVYDPANVGFVSDGADALRAGSLHDTALTGNSNAGHTYGTELPPDSKNALLEYLKTL
jgi:mono/diheme cytochrome c family protein